MPQPDPIVTSFIMADHVFPYGGKWCLMGVFDSIQCSGFPALHPTLGMLFVTGNAEGAYDIRIEICDPDGVVLGKIDGIRVEADDRVPRRPLGFQTGPLVLPKEGEYTVRVFFNGKETVGDCRFFAMLKLRSP